MTERTLHYIPHSRLQDWLMLGWIVIADLGPVHGQYSVMGEWLCGCKVRVPV